MKYGLAFLASGLGGVLDSSIKHRYMIAKESTKRQKNQSEKFIKAAKELGCNMTQEEFEKTLKSIASMKPMTNAELKKKAKKKKI